MDYGIYSVSRKKFHFLIVCHFIIISTHADYEKALLTHTRASVDDVARIRRFHQNQNLPKRERRERERVRKKMDKIRISSWSICFCLQGEIESLKELCAQRDDSYMSTVRSSVGQERRERRGGFFEKGGCDCRYCSDEW